MSVLVLGGSRFIGRHIVEALCAAGHQVTTFSRGASPDPFAGAVEHCQGNRNDGESGLAALAGRSWDACIDVSGYTPLQVQASAKVLRGRVGRYLFVSTVSVYDLGSHGPVVETDALLPAADEQVTEVTNDTYGPLKVTCERIVRDTFGTDATILRPQIVAGPFDPTARHTYWVQRSLHPGPVAAPGSGADHVQVVDARDIARFTVTCIDNRISGIFNMAGPRMTWAAFLDLLGIEQPVWIASDALRAAHVTFAEMPLFIEDGAEHCGVMHVDASAADAAGFRTTDPRVTIADTRAWLREHPFTSPLTSARERELIAVARG